MKIGVQLQPQATSVKELRAAWRAADALGVDSIWTWDHFYPLYGDPEVMFGGVKVGGIRISHVSHIKDAMVLNLSASRGKRKPVRVEPLRMPEVQPYPDDLFAERLPAMRAAIDSGDWTVEQVLEKARKTGTLSEQQIAAIRAVQTEETE